MVNSLSYSMYNVWAVNLGDFYILVAHKRWYLYAQLTDAGKCNQIKEVAVYTTILIYLLAGTATSWFPTFKVQYYVWVEQIHVQPNMQWCPFFKKRQVMRCNPIWVTNVTSLLLKIMSVHAVSTSKVSPYICISGLVCIVMAVLAVTNFTQLRSAWHASCPQY